MHTRVQQPLATAHYQWAVHFGTRPQKWQACACMHVHSHSCKHTRTFPLVRAAGKHRCMHSIYMSGRVGWSIHLFHKWSCALMHTFAHHTCRSIPSLPPPTGHQSTKPKRGTVMYRLCKITI